MRNQGAPNSMKSFVADNAVTYSSTGIKNQSKDRNVWATLIGGLEVRLARVRGTVTRLVGPCYWQCPRIVKIA